ncbi:MAG: MurR/RpiR family transcriptional regulator [Erysipelotrichaceae bacterium]
MNITEIIKNNNLDRSEQKVVKTLYEEIKKGNDRITIRQLSNKTYMSTSSIVRLSKRMGFYGYSDMVYSFRKQIQEIVEFNSNDTLSSVIISSDSLMVIDELVKDVVSGNYSRIHIIGIGYSNLVCEYLRDKLVEQCYFATCSNPSDLDSKDAFIVIYISNSGETKDLIANINGIRKNNYKAYVISSQENSTICKMIDKKIIIKQNQDDANQNSYFTGNAIILMEKIAKAVYHSKRMED